MDRSCISCGRCATKIFFSRRRQQFDAFRRTGALSYVASLDRGGERRKILTAQPHKDRIAYVVNASVHRYEESINGRDYLIEVRAVSENRWRAYIVRIPGVPTALMPFYGQTPDEAARQLSAWLTRAHQRAANTTPPV